jgi:hypothetical protein
MKSIRIVLLAGLVMLGSVVGIVSPASANINPAGFKAGRIIDDAIFYDPSGMGTGNEGVANIQRFLDAHVPACDTWGTQPSGYGGTRAQYAASQGWPGPPYVCLDDYHENPSTGETSFEKGGGAFTGGVSAARIIYNAAQDHRINPKVLLVMLRKESLNLFSDSWPLKSQYKYAMGYACPDSGPGYSANCDASKAGFLNQMNYAAWQLRYYYNNMGSYNYAPGRWNTIQYSPNPACGTKDVYIENNATASLYIYTPYTPNDAALNAYPGQANCGAYGNRNFWFFWQEWFGSTLLNGNFLRTEANATVYLIGDNVKYPIADGSILSAASALGGVGFTSQTYLDTIPTGSTMSRFIRSPDGTIYFFDANIKLAFTSCTTVAAFGGSCGTEAQLSQAEVDKFVTGPNVTRGMKTTSGRTYYIDGGTKREVLDPQSLTAAGLSTNYNVLSDSAFNNLPYGNPYARSGAIVKSRQNASKRLIGEGSTFFNLKKSSQTDKAFAPVSGGTLDEQSIQKLNISSQSISDYIRDANGTTYLLTEDGKKQIVNPASFGAAAVTLGADTLGKVAGTGALSNPSLVKSVSNGTVYVIVNGQKRPLVAMEDLRSITGQDSPYIGWASDEAIAALPTGNIIIGAGRLVKTPESATVYMTDGYDQLIPMSSFGPSQDLGVNQKIRQVSSAVLSRYTIAESSLGSYVTCDQSSRLGMGGGSYDITLSGRTPRVLQDQTCNVLQVKSPLPEFLKALDGTIYRLESGTARPIKSWSTYQSLSSESGGATVSISDSTLALLPKGSSL